MIPAAILMRAYWLSKDGKTVGKRTEVVSQDGNLRRYDDRGVWSDAAPTHSFIGPALPTLEVVEEGGVLLAPSQLQEGYEVEDITGNSKAQDYVNSLHLYRGPFGMSPVTQIPVGAYHPRGNKVFTRHGVGVVLRAINLRPNTQKDPTGWFSFVFETKSAMLRWFSTGPEELKRYANLANISVIEGTDFLCELTLSMVLQVCRERSLPIHISDQLLQIFKGSNRSIYDLTFNRNAGGPVHAKRETTVDEALAATEMVEQLSYMRNRGELIITGLTPLKGWEERKIKSYTCIPLEVKLNPYNVPF